MKRWCCEKCGHVHPGINPPMICPKCEADQESFKYRKLRKEDYAKVRQTKKRLPDRADILVLGTGVAAFTAAFTASYYGASVIMIEAGTAIGGDGDRVGFSNHEKAAAFKSIEAWEAAGQQFTEDEDSKYKRYATSMLELLADEELLPEFKEVQFGPKGAPHPWQEFAESTLLDSYEPIEFDTSRTLLHQLAHWSTDNEIRMLINHELLEYEVDKDNKVTGIKVIFNEKERVYHADVGIIAFLGDENESLIPEDLKLEDLKNLTAIDYIPNIEPKKFETDFWGKDACIGPAMTSAFKASYEMIEAGGVLDRLDELEA